MKHLKKYKLFETGEWSSDVDLEYCEENPDDDCEECNWIRWFNEQLELIIDNIDDKDLFQIDYIRGYDLYSGPYAKVKIFGKYFKIWTLENDLIIEDFFIINSTSNNSFIGDWAEISDIINEIEDEGGPELYLKSKKYNL